MFFLLCSIFKEKLLSSLDQNCIFIYFNFNQPLSEKIRMWLYEWTFIIPTFSNEKLILFPFHLGKTLWEAFVLRCEFLKKLNFHLCLFKIVTCVYVTKQVWDISICALCTYSCDTKKVRGSYWKTGRCPTGLGELEKILMVENSLLFRALCCL